MQVDESVLLLNIISEFEKYTSDKQSKNLPVSMDSFTDHLQGELNGKRLSDEFSAQEKEKKAPPVGGKKRIAPTVC